MLSDSCVQLIFPILFIKSNIGSVIGDTVQKIFRNKLRCAQQALRNQKRVFGIHFRKGAEMKSSMSFLPSFLAICPINFTTNDDIFCLCLR